MGPGIQQPTMEQGGEGSSLADVFKVLYEPGAVFERVRERPSFLMPFLVICVVQLAIFFFNMPFMKAGMAAQMAGRPAGGPDPSKFLWIGAIFVPLTIGLILVIAGGLLWVLVSVFGGEAKFSTLMGVAALSSIPSTILLSIVGTIVIHLQGTGQITSMQDLQPALGLDLLVPARGFLGAVLKGINPFSIWGFVLTAIGVSTTHRLSKSTGYIVATISLVIGLCIAGVFGALGNRGG
jgi:hypothetical protein